MKFLKACANLLWAPDVAVESLFTGMGITDCPKANIVLLDDASRSMAESDMKPSRYVAAIQAALEYNRKRAQVSPGSRTCLCLFNDDAWVAVPPMKPGPEFDSALRHCLKREPNGTTDFIAALRLARVCLSSDYSEHRIIILSDGNHCEGGKPSAVIQLAERIRSEGTFIEAVGIGAREDVNEELLIKMVSVVDGRPLYRWIGDSETELVRHYGDLAIGSLR